MNINRALRAGLLAVFAAFIMAIWEPLHDIVIDTGDSAPQFSITADEGQQISPRDFGGKALLLNFWATWCQPCAEEIPSLDALAEALGPKGLVVFAISSNKDASTYNTFLRRKPLHFLTVRQPDETIQLKYGTIQIPESYLIDRTGKVRAKFISNQNWTSPEIVSLVQSLL